MKFSTDIESSLETYWALDSKDKEEAFKLIDNITPDVIVDNYKKRLVEIFSDPIFSDLQKIEEDNYFLVFWLYNLIIKEEKIIKQINNDEKNNKKIIKEKLKQEEYIDEFLFVRDMLEINSENKQKFIYSKLDRYGLELLYQTIYIKDYVTVNWISTKTKWIKLNILKDCLYDLFFNDKDHIKNRITWKRSDLKNWTIHILETIDYEVFIKFKDLIFFENINSIFIKEEKSFSRYVFSYIKYYIKNKLSIDVLEWFKKYQKEASWVMSRSF